MIPSRSLQRRLVATSVGALLFFGAAACGGDDGAVAPATTFAPVASGDLGTTVSPQPDATDDTEVSSTSQAPSSSTAPPASNTVPAGSSTTTKPGATTIAPGTGATTTVKANSTTTTVRTTPTTAKPPSTTTAAPPTTKPVSSPGTFTATVANRSHRTLNVPFNATVVLTVTSATDEEFHVHGYDITKGGTNVTFVFTADMKGTYIVESHDTGWVVCTLVVA